MIVVMDKSATKEMTDHVLHVIEERGLRGEAMFGDQRTAIGVIGEKEKLDEGQVIRLPGVKEILLVSKPYKKVSREYKPEDSVIEVKSVKFGTGKPVIIAGIGSATDTHCVHNREHLLDLKAVRISAEKAYKMAKVKARDIDVAELHDAFIFLELCLAEESRGKIAGANHHRNGSA